MLIVGEGEWNTWIVWLEIRLPLTANPMMGVSILYMNVWNKIIKYAPVMLGYQIFNYLLNQIKPNQNVYL